MRILFLDAYFEPEITSYTHLEKDLMDALVAFGYDIDVVCPTPTRGIDGQTAKKYSKIREQVLYDGKVRVHRFWAPQEGRNTLIRAFRYFWCNLRSFSVAKKLKGFDLIFCNSTPPIQGLVAAKLKKKFNVPFVYNLQDIFPDSLVGAGKTKEGSFIWKMGRRIENKTYAAADKIIVISNAFKKNNSEKGVSDDKVRVVYNWVDADLIKPIGRRDNRLFDELGISRDGFIVVYAGNFGKAQGVKVILDSANLLKVRSDIKFVLFGCGAEYEEMIAYKEQNNIDNVIITPLLPQERVSEVYSLGDVNLITCKKGLGAASFPSKTWSIMACNSRIIASYDTDSELAKVIADSNAGLVVEPEDPIVLADAIVKEMTYNHEVDLRKFLSKVADKTSCVTKYVEVIKGML